MNTSIKTTALFGILSVFACSGGAAYKDSRPNVRETIIKTPTAELSLREYSAQGPAIVLLHGGPGVPDYLHDTAEILHEQGFHVLTYNQRGVGDSRSLNGSFKLDEHVADLEAVRRELGLKKMHLLGHSWGGLLAQLYAAKYPANTASLVLANSSTGIGSDWVSMEKEVMAYNQRTGGMAAFAGMGFWSLMAMLPGQTGDRAMQKVFRQVWFNYSPLARRHPPTESWLDGVSAASAQKTRQAIMDGDANRLNKVAFSRDTPTLILYGKNDIYGGETIKLKERFPGARFIVLEKSGHLPWLDSPEEYRSLLQSFYKNI